MGDWDADSRCRHRLSPWRSCVERPSPSAADVGANDDSAKHSDDGGAALYAEMAVLGLRQTVIGVRFVPSEAMVIQDKPLLDRAIASAQAAGLRVVLAVYPYPPREIEAGLSSPSLFASYVGVLASIYPEVKQFVIGNEPNQPAFWRPQFDAAGQNASAPAFGPYLAAAYDVLKAVDPAITVIGVGLSPRGNDRPNARNNISTSPVRFLRALGAWYRKSGRTLPLMDGFSFHPYPNEATDPLERGYSWPNAGFANLDRLKQALWDAFHGTAQPTTSDGLELHLDEVGWQVDTAGRPGLSRPGERAGHGRGDAGRDLRPAHPRGGVRPRRRLAQLLRLPRRRASHGLPGRSRACRRLACARRRMPCGRDRRFGVRGRAPCMVSGPRRARHEGRRRRRGD